MKNTISYEWCCEYVDENDNIQNNHFSNRKDEVWPPKWFGWYPDYGARLCLVRYSKMKSKARLCVSG